MKQTIEIEVPDGKKAVWKDNKVIFEDIKPQLPKTWKEFCENHDTKKGEHYIDDSCNLVAAIRGYKRDVQKDRNLLPSMQAAEAHLALMQLHQLRDCYRNGWLPDWKEQSVKHTILIDNDDIVVGKSYVISCFLAFQTEELAEEFLNNFRELIEEAGDLI